MPLGKVTVIEGALASGKSSVAFDLAARVGTRQPWPDGTPAVLPAADVLVISRHDEAERIVENFHPQTEGGQRLFRFTGFSMETPDVAGKSRRPVAFPFDLAALDVHLEFHTTIGVVVIDPLSDFCDTPKLLAETLHQLNALAARHRIAVIVTVPANCRTDAQGRLRVTSRWPTDAARCAWCLLPDPDDVTRRLFVAKRTNFCREPDGLAFRLEENGVAWEAQSAISPIDPLGQLSACESCLQELLSAGHLAASTLFRLGAERGFSATELRGAARRLGVSSSRIGFGGDGHWYWSLPGAGPATVAACAREMLSRTLFVDNELPPKDEVPAVDGEPEGTGSPALPGAGRERPYDRPVDPPPVAEVLDIEPEADASEDRNGTAEATGDGREARGAQPVVQPVVQPAAGRRMSRRQRRRERRRQNQALNVGRNGDALSAIQ